MKETYKAPCEVCGGTCCGYLAIEIDKPVSKQDYDHIRWYLLHENVAIFQDHWHKWFIEFRTPCTKQLDDKRCGIYNTRPKICRTHGTEDGDCEHFDSPYQLHFSDVEKYEKYLTKKAINWQFKKLPD